ncbi:fimbrial protein [Cedecea davisae]|uniref:fimbrial protein n=1 Tax=Cedecea davisae TaxID=158484 RepID=UPI001D0A78C0|nr:fimbrial protein [Cedecea davisae]
MNKFASLSAVAVLMTSAFAANAASTGTITFNGMVTDTTCDVTVDGQAADATVVLPTVPATELASAGQTTGRTNFNMSLKDCVVGTQGEKTVAAFFQTGATVDNNTGRLKQTETTGASNVSLQLRDGTNDNVIFAGNENQATSNNFAEIKDGEDVTLPYSVEYYAEGKSTAGVVASSVVYNLQYK